MARALVAVVLLAGCAGASDRPMEVKVDPHAICRLVEGEVSTWRGLGELGHRQLPACLGGVVRKGTRAIAGGTLASDTYRPATARGEVRVDWWMNGDRVALVDLLPSPPMAPESLRAALGDPDLTYRYLADDLAWAELAAPPGGSVNELVYGARGLAVLVSHDASGTASVIRLRGFAPMPSADYLDDHVRLRPEPLE